MNATVARWLAGNPVGAMIIAALLARLPGITYVLPGAIVAFITLQRGPRVGAIVAAGAVVLLTAPALWLTDVSLPQALGLPATLFAPPALLEVVPPLVLAALLARSQSLSLCLQVGALLAIAAILLLHASFGDPGALSKPIIAELDKSVAQYLHEHAMPRTAEVDAFIHGFETIGSRLWGWAAAQAYLLGMCAVFLGRRWQANQEQPGAFGTEFRGLRLGLALGAAAAVLIALSIWLDNALIDEIAIVFSAALLLIGIAAAHRFRVQKGVHVIWLWVMYIGLLVVMPVMVALLATWGFIDNWLRSSRPVAAT